MKNLWSELVLRGRLLSWTERADRVLRTPSHSLSYQGQTSLHLPCPDLLADVHNEQSCRGFEVDSAKLSPTGLEHDRQFMLVDAATHKFLTARTIPKVRLPRFARASLRLTF